MAALTNRYEDDDASHLPPGMKRVGYDADTERYTFREGDDLWLGEPGSFYGGRMKRAGRAPDAAPTKQQEDDTDSSGDDNYPATPSSTKQFHEHTRKALSQPKDLQGQDDGNGWGVPVVSISATGAEPPDMPDDKDTGLKRRATKLKEVALSTADTLGVARRWTRKRGNSGAAQSTSFLDQERRDGPESEGESVTHTEKISQDSIA